MNSNNLFKNYFLLVRPLNLLITFLSVITASFLCLKEFTNLNIVLMAGLSAALTAAAGNVINDILDYKIDKINRPERIIVSGKISKQHAVYLYISLVALSLIISFGISLFAFVFVLLTNVLLYLYSSLLKRIPLLGNFVVAYLTGMAFIFGGLVVQNINSAWVPAVFALQINLIREIIKDIEDLKGDGLNNTHTLSSLIGITKTCYLVVLLSLVLIISTIVPFFIELYNLEYLLTVLFTVDFLLVVIIKNVLWDKNIQLRKISNMLKLAMLFGLIAIIVGSL